MSEIQISVIDKEIKVLPDTLEIPHSVDAVFVNTTRYQAIIDFFDTTNAPSSPGCGEQVIVAPFADGKPGRLECDLSWTVFDVEFKYDVTLKGSGLEPLDPVIIVNGGLQYMALPVIVALVVGLLAGFLVQRWWSGRNRTQR